jgi:EAL domain-containing protein (putative c-di-GMP-specific phosphodiesterase class I)
VSVNVSGRHFQDPSLVQDVRSALAESDLPGAALTIEITESILMKHTEATLTKLRELKALGVSLAVDDFGTGYSCLGYLQRFPIDVLKIDKAFVDGVAEGTDQSAIARAIVGLSKEMKKDVVAEGIEREEQAAALVTLDCKFGQGYLFARPAPPEELEGFFGDRRALPEA